MPVLRLPEDNSIGSTFGSLGQALSNAWNPKTRAEAWELQQRIMLQNMQLQIEQRKAQAADQAVQQFGHIVPPDKLPYIAYQIYSGAPYEQVARAAAQLSGQLIDDTTPEATQHNIRYMEQLTGQPWKEVYAPIAGAKTQQAANDALATQAGKVSGQQKAGELGATQAATANPLPGYLPGLQKQKEAEAAGTAQGDVDVKGFPLNDPRFIPGQPNLPLAQPQPPQGQGNQAPPTPPQVLTPNQPQPQQPQPPISPDVSVPSPSAPGYAPPTPVVRNVPGGTVIGQSAPEAESQKQQTENNRTMLAGAYSEGAAAYRLKNTLGQLRDLETIVNSGGVSGQLAVAAAKRLSDAGIVVGDVGQAYSSMNNLLNTEIPELRKQAGIQRLAGPEIQATGKIIGSATMPPAVLNNIIANEEAAADAQIQRSVNAANTLGWSNTPMTMPQYIQADTDLNNQLKQHTDELRKQYAAIGTGPAVTAQQKPPPAPTGQVTVAAPAPVPAPSSTGVPPAVATPAPVPVPAPAPETPAPPVPSAQVTPSPRPKIYTLGPDGKLQEMLQQ